VDRAGGSVAEDSAEVAGLGQRPMQLFLGTLTLTMSNPKTMIFYLALLPTIVPLEALKVGGYVEIAAAILVILPVFSGRMWSRRREHGIYFAARDLVGPSIAAAARCWRRPRWR
jgi:threonine/homoserine/homoserine lactone efflux protein